MRWLLPESPEFLARRLPATGKASVTSVFVPEFRHDTSALWIAFFSCLLSVYLGFAWLTTLLTTAGFGSVRVRPLPADPDAKGPALFAAVAVKQ